MTKYHSYIIKIVSIVTLAAFIVTQCGLSYAFEPKSGPISSKLRQMQRMEQLASEVKDSGQAAPAPATGIVAPGEKAMPTAGEVGIANAVAAEDKTWLFGEGIIPYNPQARAEAVVENCPNRATKNRLKLLILAALAKLPDDSRLLGADKARFTSEEEEAISAVVSGDSSYPDFWQRNTERVFRAAVIRAFNGADREEMALQRMAYVYLIKEIFPRVKKAQDEQKEILFERDYSFKPTRDPSRIYAEIRTDLSCWVYGLSDKRFDARDGTLTISDPPNSSGGIYMSEITRNAVDAIIVRSCDQKWPPEYKGIVKVMLAKRGDSLILHVDDNGTGIAMKELAGLFKENMKYYKEPYLRGGIWLQAGGGFGVRLYGRGIVEAAGGKIEIDTFHPETGAHKLVYRSEDDIKIDPPGDLPGRQEQGTSVEITLPGFFASKAAAAAAAGQTNANSNGDIGALSVVKLTGNNGNSSVERVELPEPIKGAALVALLKDRYPKGRADRNVFVVTSTSERPVNDLWRVALDGAALKAMSSNGYKFFTLNGNVAELSSIFPQAERDAAVRTTAILESIAQADPKIIVQYWIGDIVTVEDAIREVEKNKITGYPLGNFIILTTLSKKRVSKPSLKPAPELSADSETSVADSIAAGLFPADQETVNRFLKCLRSACTTEEKGQKEAAISDLLREFGPKSQFKGVTVVPREKGAVHLFKYNAGQKDAAIRLGDDFKGKPARLSPYIDEEGNLCLAAYATEESEDVRIDQPLRASKWNGEKFVSQISRWDIFKAKGKRKLPKKSNLDGLAATPANVSRVTGLPLKLLEKFVSQDLITLSPEGEMDQGTAQYLIETSRHTLTALEYRSGYVAELAGLDITTVQKSVRIHERPSKQVVERVVLGYKTYFIKFPAAAAIILEQGLKQRLGGIMTYKEVAKALDITSESNAENNFTDTIEEIHLREIVENMPGLPEEIRLEVGARLPEATPRIQMLITTRFGKGPSKSGVEKFQSVKQAIKSSLPEDFVSLKEAVVLLEPHLGRVLEKFQELEAVVIAARELGHEVIDFRAVHPLFALTRSVYIRKSDLPDIAARVKLILEKVPLKSDQILAGGFYSKVRILPALGYTSPYSASYLVRKGRLAYAIVDGEAGRPGYFRGSDVLTVMAERTAAATGQANAKGNDDSGALSVVKLTGNNGNSSVERVELPEPIKGAALVALLKDRYPKGRADRAVFIVTDTPERLPNDLWGIVDAGARIRVISSNGYKFFVNGWNIADLNVIFPQTEKDTTERTAKVLERIAQADPVTKVQYWSGEVTTVEDAIDRTGRNGLRGYTLGDFLILTTLSKKPVSKSSPKPALKPSPKPASGPSIDSETPAADSITAGLYPADQETVSRFKKCLELACMSEPGEAKTRAITDLINEFGPESQFKGVTVRPAAKGFIHLFFYNSFRFVIRVRKDFVKKPIRLSPYIDEDGNLCLAAYATEKSEDITISKPIRIWKWSEKKFISQTSQWDITKVRGSRKLPEKSSLCSEPATIENVSRVTGLPLKLLKEFVSQGLIELSPEGEMDHGTAQYLIDTSRNVLTAREYSISYVGELSGLSHTVLHKWINVGVISSDEKIERTVYGRKIFFIKFPAAARLILEEGLKHLLGGTVTYEEAAKDLGISSLTNAAKYMPVVIEEIHLRQVADAMPAISEETRSYVSARMPEVTPRIHMLITVGLERNPYRSGIKKFQSVMQAMKSSLPEGFVSLKEAVALIEKYLGVPLEGVYEQEIVLAARECGCEVLDFRASHTIFALTRSVFINMSDLPNIAARVKLILENGPLKSEQILPGGFYTRERIWPALGYTSSDSLKNPIKKGKLKYAIASGSSNRPGYFRGSDVLALIAERRAAAAGQSNAIEDEVLQNMQAVATIEGKDGFTNGRLNLHPVNAPFTRCAVVSDIHGNFGKLRKAIWAYKEVYGNEPKIIYLGDYLGRGLEGIHGTEELFVRDFEVTATAIAKGLFGKGGLVDSGKAIALLGNHELEFLSVMYDEPPHGGAPALFRQWLIRGTGKAVLHEVGIHVNIDDPHSLKLAYHEARDNKRLRKLAKNMRQKGGIYLMDNMTLFTHLGLPVSSEGKPLEYKGKKGRAAIDQIQSEMKKPTHFFKNYKMLIDSSVPGSPFIGDPNLLSGAMFDSALSEYNVDRVVKGHHRAGDHKVEKHGKLITIDVGFGGKREGGVLIFDEKGIHFADLTRKRRTTIVSVAAQAAGRTIFVITNVPDIEREIREAAAGLISDNDVIVPIRASGIGEINNALDRLAKMSEADRVFMYMPDDTAQLAESIAQAAGFKGMLIINLSENRAQWHSQIEECL